MGANAVGRIDRRLDRRRPSGVYPDFYGGSFARCPDSVDFSYHQIVNIYRDANAYFIDKGWVKVERPSDAVPTATSKSMMKDENWYELVVGNKSRSGGQWRSGKRPIRRSEPYGYPRRLWNKETGEIDKSVAQQWKKYDMREILRTYWPALGPRSQISFTSTSGTWTPTT